MDPALFSPWHIAILAVVILLVFGPKKLPEIGRSLGTSMREFKDSITGFHERLDDEATPEAQLPAAPKRADHDAL
jgi:sec-independent protein translocase protein TatA